MECGYGNIAKMLINLSDLSIDNTKSTYVIIILYLMYTPCVALSELYPKLNGNQKVEMVVFCVPCVCQRIIKKLKKESVPCVRDQFLRFPVSTPYIHIIINVKPLWNTSCQRKETKDGET